MSTAAGNIEVTGHVCCGRGLASSHLMAHTARLSALLGGPVQPGSLNIALDRPIRLNLETSDELNRSQGRMVWQAALNGIPILLYRWADCPLSVVEVISRDHLRRRLDLSDGAKVILDIPRNSISPLSLRSQFGWALIWMGRSRLYYRDSYAMYTVSLQRFLLAGQAAEPIGLLDMTTKMTKSFIDKLGRTLRGLAPWTSQSSGQSFERIPVRSGQDGQIDRLRNILAYTKLSGSAYSAQNYPAGYHTLSINGATLAGQRQPAARLDLLPFPLTGKTVLDIGCNQGGMLFEAARRGIRQGVGIDYDPRMINAANSIRQHCVIDSLNFFTFDLEKDPLELVSDFLPDDSVDIVFLLSVCMWISNWRTVIDHFSRLSPRMLFESNGSAQQQDAQEAHLRSTYNKVEILQSSSPDDRLQSSRGLYYCTQ